MNAEWHAVANSANASFASAPSIYTTTGSANTTYSSAANLLTGDDG